MRGSTILVILGVLMVFAGMLALANPFAASLAVTTLVGIALTVAGAVQLWVAITDRALPHRGWTAIVGLVGLVAGISLLADPLSGLVSLTLLVGIVFLVIGVARLAMAWRMRETPLFWFLLISGAASALIGIMVVANIAAAATSLLGLLLGIQLIADGIALIVVGQIARRR